MKLNKLQTKKNLKRKLGGLNFYLGERWLDSFIIKVKEPDKVQKKLIPEFILINIAVGRDYNDSYTPYTYYLKPKENKND